MNRYIFFCLGISFWGSIQAQKTTINWEGTEVVDYGIEKITYPKFSNPGYEPSDHTVYINIKGRSDGRKYVVKNVVWEKTSAKNIGSLYEYSLPEIERKDVSYYIDPTENTEFYNAKISALKFEDGNIYRLVSFEIASENTRQSVISAKNISTTENPFKSGTFYKIKVDKSGVFKITKQFLQNNGINVNNINPKNFRIYGNGGLPLPEFNQDKRYSTLQENAIQVIGEEDGVWNDGDYALFYAQGPHGFNLYSGDNRNIRKETRLDASRHLNNIYEDYAYYFINFDIGEGKRVQEQDENLPSTLITRYDDYQFINDDKTNILKLGRIWVDDPIPQSGKTLKFNTKSTIQNNDVISYRTAFVGHKASSNNIKFDINGESRSLSIPNNAGEYVHYKTFSGTATNLSGNEISISFIPDLSSNPSGVFYFDYAEILYKENLSFNNSQMNFRSYDIIEGKGGLYGFSVSNTQNLEQIWEVSDITNATKKINKSGNSSSFNFGYSANSTIFNNEFVAFRNDAAYTPTFVGKVETQKEDLHALKNIDYLIITRKDMMNEAERLANYHKDYNQFSTAVIDVEQIYNEFSSGSKDITAIRDFITKLNNENGGLKYVLILGDTSYDFKDKTSGNDNVIPAYQSEESGNYSSSFVTDDYFVMTSPQQSIYISSILPDLPIGRLPASTTTEAKLLIDKTLAYYNRLNQQPSPFGDWRMNLHFVADDDFDGGIPFHNELEEAIKNNFEGTERNEYNVKKLYLDAFPSETSAGGQRFPQVNQYISNAFGNSLYLFYFGHGGINGWAQERVLTIDQIQAVNNYSSIQSRFPLVSTITCEFTLWDRPDMQSAGEQVIKHKNGGAATMITSSRAIGVTYGRIMTHHLTKRLFELHNNDFSKLGDAYLKAKKDRGAVADHLRVNYLGDPAMKLYRPKPLIKINSIDTPISGQLRAMDFVTITGEIINEDSSKNENFNGKISVTLFDKPITKTTLNNDNSGGLNPKLTFQEETNPITKSSSSVKNGEYTIQFYIPKEINYDIGDGRLLLYADNFETAGINAYDVFQSQVQKIGGINEAGINDNEPPKVKLYMNNTSFADGGITHRNPMFLACITDDTGINSAGAGVGHDITVVLDGEVINTVVLNEFFTGGDTNGCSNPSLADYQKGSVLYPFRNLSPGEHQLTFKVWDINNNSTTTSLNFIVKDEDNEKLILNRLLNWPNPFTNKTYIQFEHNCSDVLDVNIQIYTITGKLVRTISTLVAPEPYMNNGFRTPRQAIEWDGTDDFGATVGKGTYIYKVFAKSQNQDKCKGGATAVEKMVILK